MKKFITYRLCVVIMLSMVAIAALGFYFQVKMQKEWLRTNAVIRIEQVSQILEDNEEEIDRLTESLEEDYFIRAKAVAYIVQNYPQAMESQEEIEKVAALLQVDELHLFDTEGRIYAGSVPEYFNYTMNSGEQMQFFLPMLDDYSLKLCQGIEPNTAEGKLMQYLAIWREDHKGIVQIGMEPVRLLEAMKKNELSHIFSLITAPEGLTIFAVEPETGAVLGATDSSLVGQTLNGLGVDLSQAEQGADIFTAEVSGTKRYCVFQQVDDMLLGVSSTYDYLYGSLPENMILLVLGLCVLSMVIIFLIINMLDRFIIRGIHELIGGMKKISGGNLDYRVDVASVPEFVELSSSMNSMVLSLLENTNKFSLVFKNVDIPIAVYEYAPDMDRVLATSQIGDILMLPEAEVARILSNKKIFREKIEQICADPFDLENDIYVLRGDEERYLRIKFYEEESGTLGIIIDVTEETIEKQKVEFERDVDFLTGLSSRRAFYDSMGQIYSQPEVLKEAVLFMLDLDELKRINDTWGHEYGDRLLAKVGELLKECWTQDKLAARLGGDEFVLLLYGADSQRELADCIDSLSAQVTNAALRSPQNEPIPVSMSGGYVFSADFLEHYDQTISLADQTMYRAKKEYKGQFLKYENLNFQ